MENVKQVKWSIAPSCNGVYPKDLFTFDDVLPQETKSAYFQRKQLIDNFDYWKAVFLKMQNSKETSFWGFDNLIPEGELGGKEEWVDIKSVKKNAVLGAVFIEKSRSVNECFYAFETTLSKNEFFLTEKVVDLVYVRELVRLHFEVTDERYRYEFMQLIPVECGGDEEWLHDFTEENTAAVTKYKQQQAEEREALDAVHAVKRQKRNEKAKERRDAKNV